MLIEELNFSVRTYNCLKRRGIDTVEKLKEKSEEDLMKIRGFGAGCLKEVREKLKGPPVIPGPEESNPNIMEVCFRNGEQHMKEKVISILMDHQVCKDGSCYRCIADIVRKVESL